MGDLIPHRDDICSYAEKLRRVMGLERLHWRSAQLPIVGSAFPARRT
jgi:hypothetical protein